MSCPSRTAEEQSRAILCLSLIVALSERWNAARYLTNERYILIACYWLQEDGFQNNKDNHLIVLKNKEEYIKKFGRTAKNKKKLEEIERDLHESWGNIKEPNNFDPIFHFIR
mgnify:CR=1 FL=1